MLTVLVGAALVPPSPLVIVNVRDPKEEAEVSQQVQMYVLVQV